jgi:hypothetical protein
VAGKSRKASLARVDRWRTWKAPPQALLAWPTGGWRLGALEYIPARTQGSSLELAWCVAGCNCKFATTRTVRSVTSCGGRMVTCACAVRFELDMEVGPDVWSAYVHTVYIHVQIGKVPTQRTHRPTRAFPVHILRTCDASAPCPSSRRGAEHQSLRTSNVMFPSPARRRQGIYGHHNRALERIPARLHAPSSPTVSFLTCQPLASCVLSTVPTTLKSVATPTCYPRWLSFLLPCSLPFPFRLGVSPKPHRR